MKTATARSTFSRFKSTHSQATFIVILMVYLQSSHSTARHEIIVCPQSTQTEMVSRNCSGLDINEAFKNVTLDTQITLLPGTHTLSELIPMQNTTGVRIVGLKHSTTILTCGNELIGLVFDGFQNLTIKNLIVENCSAGRQNIGVISNLLSIMNTFRDDLNISTSIKQSRVALFLINCQNVSISSVIVRNTNGTGLFGINTLGMEIKNSTFANNRCDGSVTGGGVILLYLDYHTPYPLPQQITATISNSIFLNNVDCSSNCTSEFWSSDCESSYKVGGGGGLTIILSQLSFGVNVEILSTRFEKNSAIVSGGVYVSTFRGVDNSSIKVSDCLFDGNRGLETNSIAGGMMVSINLPYPSTLQEDSETMLFGQKNSILVIIEGTTFTNNVANIAGGVYVSSLRTEPDHVNTVHVVVDRCQFEENSAQRISALLICQESLDKLLQNSLKVVLKHSNFTRNFLNLDTKKLYEYSATVGIWTANVTLNGTQLLNNYVIALYALQSSIYVVDRVIFSNNFGFDCGGGLKLTDSFLVLSRNSTASFTNNTARKGGAICVDNAVSELESWTWRQHNTYDCFVCCSSVESSNCEELHHNANITFKGNSAATESGSAIFGVNVNKECPHLFEFDILLVSNETISTPVNRIQLNYSQEPIMPGDTFDVTVVPYDSLDNSVSDIVFYSYRHISAAGTNECQTNEKIIFAHTTIVSSDDYLITKDTAAPIPVTVYGAENTCILVRVWSQSSLRFEKFTVHLTTCRIGFNYKAVNKFDCECDETLQQKFGVQCDRNTFGVLSTMWFGPLQLNNESEATSKSNYFLVVQQCPLNYCHNYHNSINNVGRNNFNFQCTKSLNRNGLLCGICKENFSVTMGTSQCKECSNYYLFLIAPFALFGLLLIIAMAKLRITISEGFLNSVLFYCNVANYLYAHLFPEGDYYLSLIILAGVLSIKPRLGLCLFDGMTSLHYFLFQYAFVLYLYALLGAFLLLVRLKVITTHSPIKLFASLLLLCYGSVTELCITTLALLRVQTLDGTVYWRWYIDPTVHYGQGLHLFLCIMAIILMFIYIIPTTFLTIIPQRVYNIRYVGRLKPLYDAVWAPFKPQYRWWFGFRLMLRWVVMIIATFLHFSLPFSTFALVIILSVLSYLHTTLSPFQGTWQNRTDSFLLANLVLLVIGALYFQNDIISPVPGQIIYSGILVTSAYILFVVLLLRHLYSRFSVRVKRTFSRFKLSMWKRGYTLHSTQEESETSSDEEDEAGVLTQSDSSVQVEGEGPRQGELNLWQQENTDPESEELGLRSKVVTFSEFREPLLDEGEAEMTTFATLRRKVKLSTKK